MRKNILVILTIGILIGSAVNIFAGGVPGKNPKSNSNKNRNIRNQIIIGLLDFTGDTSGIDQNSIRGSMAENLKSKGFSAGAVSSVGTEKGRFQYFIGVEIKRSGKLGLTINMTLYGKEMNVIKQFSKSRTGVPDDSVRPIALKGLDELAPKIK
jgi:hypothetical protein